MSRDKIVKLTLPELLRNVRQRYQLCDGEVKRQIKRHRVRCERGCGACCYQLVGITFVEALLIADFIVRNRPADYVSERLAVLDDLAERVRGDRDAYFRGGRYPCAFLVEGQERWSGECSIYNVRPLACRLEFVVSDPALCAPGRTYECTRVDTREAHLKMVALISGGNPILSVYGPFAPLVAEAIRVIRDKKGVDEAGLRRWRRRMDAMINNDREKLTQLGLKERYV